jgi:hypothetical protein
LPPFIQDIHKSSLRYFVMKNLRIVLATLVITVSVITLSSFVSDNFDGNAFATVCYKYTGPIPARPVDMESSSNWVSATQAQLIAECPDLPNLCGICYDNTQFPSVQAALNLLGAFVRADDDDNFYDVVTTNGQVITDPATSKSIELYVKP